jgi:hypothetical protein
MKLRDISRRYPWLWPILACVVLFVLILVFSPVLRVGIFTAK